MGNPGEILFLVHRIPYPPDRGDKIRSYHLLKALSEIAPVHVGCFADDARDMAFASDLAKVTASQCVVMRDRSRLAAGVAGLLRDQPILVTLYENARLKQWVADLLDEWPVRAIVAYSVQMAQFVPHDPAPGVHVMMDFVDFDSAKYAAYGAEQRGPMGWVHRREGRVLFEYERMVARRADISTFVSAAEASAFAKASGIGRDICVLENGVDLDLFRPDAGFMRVEAPDRPLIVFTGQMDYRPNADAVMSFAHQALPAIRAVHCNASFAIVGRKPTAEVEALAALPGVIVTGEVGDVRGWLAAADVVVAPLRIARGIQNKVLEAMAMARPVVASAHAAEGIDAREGEHLLIAADPAAEADAVLALLADPARAAAMGANARSHVVARYDWRRTLAPLRAMIAGEAP